MPRADRPDVKLEVIDEQGFAAALRRHRGKVVLVDFWATWCGPCVELFPHTVQLHRRLGDQGLAVISVSLDDPVDDRADVLEFLTHQDATFENFVSRYGAGTKSIEVFEIVDGAVPHFKLYDRHGKLQKTFASGSEGIDPAQIDLAVKALLKNM
ncbi:MAG: hypothetical protein A2V70_08175 [Planctomycetes bacterium RBG_13_63_9]|nr:MAG: hypothetical protein A2V70_08175 [Planctomycetes bacterium RBG_13_63_9]